MCVFPEIFIDPGSKGVINGILQKHNDLRKLETDHIYADFADAFQVRNYKTVGHHQGRATECVGNQRKAESKSLVDVGLIVASLNKISFGIKYRR